VKEQKRAEKFRLAKSKNQLNLLKARAGKKHCSGEFVATIKKSINKLLR